MTSTYVTVAIPYVNAEPHLGYAYELVLADIHARGRRETASGRVRLLGGTDDYSLKNVLAAEAVGAPIQVFVNENAARFAALGEPLELSFDDFIRTSADPRHIPAVQRLWRAVDASGDLYRRTYEADYCVGCEQFYSQGDLVEGCCPEHRTPTERVAEENWFFRLSCYQQLLDELISSGGLIVHPEPFRNEILAFVRAGLEDISVSRSAARARGWGVPVPGDPEQVVYVWFDALANYISALDYGKPASGQYRRWWVESDERIHVIGKGILRFHAVFWPAFLTSAAEPLPTRIQVHPYLTVDGAKLSKSAGAKLDPAKLATTYGSDALRWWFARDVHPTIDTDFTLERLVQRANEDLAGGIGNLVNRIVTLLHRFRDGAVPSPDEAPLPVAARLCERVLDAIAEFDLRLAAQHVIHAVAELNRDLEATEPWKVGHHPHQTGEFDRLLARHLRTAQEIAKALAPVLPDLSRRLCDQLEIYDGKLPAASPIFARIELGAT